MIIPLFPPSKNMLFPTVFRVLNSGKLKIGSPADLILIDINTPRKLKLENMISKSKNSLFDDYDGKGKVLYTIVDGRIVYSDPKLKFSTARK
mgnify:CR=1 FL=1